MRRIVARLALAASVVALAAGLAPVLPAQAQTRVTLKSATASSSYYVMMVQLGEVLRAETKGQIQATIEESQGSVQNVKEAAKRPGNFVFTTPPSLLSAAREGRKPFEGETGYDTVRTLFVMPYVTVHFVVREDSGVTRIEDLAGKDFISGGRGTFCDGRTRTIFGLLGLEGKVNFVDVELASADNALKNRKVVGYATCSSHPTPQLQELATTMPIRILPISAAQAETLAKNDPSSSPITIAAGTYKGVPATPTVGVPVGAYATTKMDDDTAYAIVKAFWAKKDEMAKTNPWWAAVTPDLIGALGNTKLHPGALKYYKEAGVNVPASMQ
ncbi:MAG TPA: TAXI family TRAP transporter solute-binding subunit [Ferrovibrio sp.]|uniref:TAXI family TRAP transporter solute-binding subunit n=1 Tax=Ferrovibrio sp. TaxID=1917215 RepID=UPI002B4AB9AB|nr:TAXI family TRAP transporter solute-binding subunit [Ferrovibrio sp.]HLT78433.1 TAXI family TRAP transporter solute-binding subunit [Ferrovibrio sp.]